MPLPTGRDIRKAREARSLSILELAKAAGVQWHTLKELEEEEHPVRPSTLRKIVLALEKFPVLPDLRRDGK